MLKWFHTLFGKLLPEVTSPFDLTGLNGKSDMEGPVPDVGEFHGATPERIIIGKTAPTFTQQLTPHIEFFNPLSDSCPNKSFPTRSAALSFTRFNHKTLQIPYKCPLHGWHLEKKSKKVVKKTARRVTAHGR